jgi:predicted small lipoprotein YifL
MRKLMMVIFLAGCGVDGLPMALPDASALPDTTESALRPRDLGPSDLAECPTSRCRAAANGCPNANPVHAVPGCEWGWCC